METYKSIQIGDASLNAHSIKPASNATPARVMDRSILLADDEPQILSTLGRRLSHSGYYVMLARDGNEAFCMAKRERPDLIVLDVIMPKMDGVEVAAALKKHPETSRIPILFLSCLLDGWGHNPQIQLFDDWSYMGKPFQASDLMAKINKMMP